MVSHHLVDPNGGLSPLIIRHWILPVIVHFGMEIITKHIQRTFETNNATFFILSFTPKHLWRVSGVTLRAPDQRVLCRRWPQDTSCSVSQSEPRPHCQGPCQSHIMATVWTHELGVQSTLIHRDLRAVASLWHSRGQVYSSLGTEPAIHRLTVDILCRFGLGFRYTRPLLSLIPERLVMQVQL